MVLYITFFGLSFISIIITYFIWRKSKQPKIITSADHAHEILNSTQYTRHISNAWLISTLSIVNPFTIDDKSLRRVFKNKVMTTLFNWCNDTKYEELVLTIANRVEHRLSLLQLKNAKFCLSKLAKQVTLDSFLSGILNVNATEDLLTELPELIIHLWKNRTDKKAQDRLHELFLANQDSFSDSEVWQQIQTILSNHSNIISQISTNDFDEKISNPLNIIVPGWETMWRVVFYSLLELLRHPELLNELRAELNTHSKSYRKCDLLQWILKETLRLYPPTKNIYRTDIKTGQNICIDVQSIHHNQNVWGCDALVFRPDRFKEKLTAEQEKHYLPFSISCPARHGFAYIFAGAIVAEILRHCPTFTIVEESSLPPTDKLLDLARNSYNDLLIIV